jgi:hypothetical protein
LNTYLLILVYFIIVLLFRWLLLEMKREFPFEMALKALEVTWSSLPPATADTNLCLWETRFSPKMSPSTSDLSKPCETAYGKVAALRKMSVDRQLSDNTELRKRSNVGGNGYRGRIASENCAETAKVGSKINKSASAFTKRRGFSFGGTKKGSIEEKKDSETVEAATEASAVDSKHENKSKLNRGSKKKVPVKKGKSEEKSDGESETELAGKRVTNLKDFYSLTSVNNKSAGGGTEESAVPSTSVAEPAVECSETGSVEVGGSCVTVSPCKEAKPNTTVAGGDSAANGDPFDFVGYSQANAALTIYCNRLPPPTKFGHGNPFLMFLCLASLLQHRNHIMDNQLDYQENRMIF